MVRGERAYDANAVNELVFYGLPLDTWQKLPSAVSALTTADITKAVKDHLRATGVMVVVAGDKAKVLPALQELATAGTFGKDGLVVVDTDAHALPN